MICEQLKLDLGPLQDAFQKIISEFDLAGIQPDNEKLFLPIKLKINKINDDINKTILSIIKLDLQSKKMKSKEIVISIFANLNEKIKESLNFEIEKIKTKGSEVENENNINIEIINKMKKEIVEVKVMFNGSSYALRNLNDLMIDSAKEYVELQRKWIKIVEEKENQFPHLKNLKNESDLLRQTQNSLNSKLVNLQNTYSKISKDAIYYSENIEKQQKIIADKKSIADTKLLELSSNEECVKESHTKINAFKNKIINLNENLEKKKEIINEIECLIMSTKEGFNKTNQIIVEKENELEKDMNIKLNNVHDNQQMKEKVKYLECEIFKLNESIDENLMKIERRKAKRKKLKENLKLRIAYITTDIQNKEHKIEKLTRINQNLEEKHNQIVKKCISLNSIISERPLTSPTFRSFRSPKIRIQSSKLFPQD